MGAVFTVLFVLTLSLIVVRIATVALTLTGLSHQAARFQARSAFTGSGFTTNESEKVVNHPVRRQIILLLMLLGNAGIVTAVASLMLSFVGSDNPSAWSNQIWLRLLVLIGGSLALWGIAHSPIVDRALSLVIARGLKKWTLLDTRDYSGLLHLAGDYAVAELQVQPGDWLADRTLKQLTLNREGLLVLGIEQASGDFIGAPRGGCCVRAGDLLILYGRQQQLDEIDRRQSGVSGELAHLDAVAEQQTANTEPQTGQSQTDDAEP